MTIFPTTNTSFCNYDWSIPALCKQNRYDNLCESIDAECGPAKKYLPFLLRG